MISECLKNLRFNWGVRIQMVGIWDDAAINVFLSSFLWKIAVWFASWDSDICFLVLIGHFALCFLPVPKDNLGSPKSNR